MSKHHTSYPPFLLVSHVYIILIYAKRESECIAEAVQESVETPDAFIMILGRETMGKMKKVTTILAALTSALAASKAVLSLIKTINILIPK